MLNTLAANPEAEIDGAVQDLTGLLAGIFSGGREISPTAEAAMHRAALDSLKRFIDEHLDSPALSVGLICARSGWSRATVYRLFEADGGLARYIRLGRLHRAFRELMSSAEPRRRILDVALQHRFASQATFNRAFRREFGIPPGELRELATRSRKDAPPDPRRLRSAADADAMRWIKLLSAGSTAQST